MGPDLPVRTGAKRPPGRADWQAGPPGTAITPSRSASLLLEHDLFRPAFARRSIEPQGRLRQRLRAGGKPVPTFRDHALRPLRLPHGKEKLATNLPILLGPPTGPAGRICGVSRL